MANGIILQTVSREATMTCMGWGGGGGLWTVLPFPPLDVGFEVPNKFVVGYALVCVRLGGGGGEGGCGFVLCSCMCTHPTFCYCRTIMSISEI